MEREESSLPSLQAPVGSNISKQTSHEVEEADIAGLLHSSHDTGETEATLERMKVCYARCELLSKRNFQNSTSHEAIQVDTRSKEKKDCYLCYEELNLTRRSEAEAVCKK